MPVTGNVLSNDHDDNPSDSITIADPATGCAATGPITVVTDNGGSVVINPDGSYVYTPAAGYAGVDTFQYTITDTFGKTDNAIVAITVHGTGEWSVSGPENAEEGTTAQFIVSLSGTYGEGEKITVDLGLTDIDTNSSDYADLIAAIQAAVASNPDVSFNPTTGTLEYTSPADSSSMPDIVIDLGLIDDGLIEGSEDFALNLSNAASSTGANVTLDETAASHTTTILDAQRPGGASEKPGQWSVSGPVESAEGSTPEFVISLTGEYGAGEVVTVELGFTDIDTNPNDHSDIIAAIQAAVANNPNVTFDPATGTLVFTSPADGASMSDIVIDIALTDDGLIESPEAFSIALSNAQSPTGASVAVNPETGSLVSQVIDASAADSEWSIVGSTETAENETPQFTISLSGVFGAGENVSVEINFGHIDTDNNDFENVLSALQAAVDANPDLTFSSQPNTANSATAVILNDEQAVNNIATNMLLADANNSALTGTLTYTSPADGASMQDFQFEIPVLDDSLVENQETFFVSLSNSAAPGLNIGVNSERQSIETLIQDNDYYVASEPPVGAALPPPTGHVDVRNYNEQNILELAQISLRKVTTSLTEGIILEMVNRIDSLGSMFGSSGMSIPWIDRLHRDGGPLAQSVLNDFNNEEDSTGYSSGVGYRGTFSVDPTDECGRFFIDTIIRDSMLSVIARSTIDAEKSSGVSRFSATLASGAPLPDWISQIADGEYVINPTISPDTVALKLTAHRESGWGLERFVEINTLTGEIKELEAQNESGNQ